MVALYDYAAQGSEDLEFSEGDTIDILGEGEVPAVSSCLVLVAVSHSSVVSCPSQRGVAGGALRRQRGHLPQLLRLQGERQRHADVTGVVKVKHIHLCVY